MITYKTNILSALKRKGYSSYRLRQEKILAEGTLQRIRTGSTAITLDSLSVICDLLDCQPGDLIERITDDTPQEITFVLKYKMDILAELQRAGYTSARIQQESILTEETLQKLSTGDVSITMESLKTLCNLLDCQPGDLIERIPEKGV